MRITRIYQSTKLQSGLEIVLNQEAANHLVRVLRLPLRSTVHVFNGEGGEYAATIESIKKNQVVVKIGEYLAVETESTLQIHLGQGISRGEKMDYTIQKAVELGVTCITPLLTERCGVKLSNERWEKRLQHWRAIIIAACEQSGRNIIPFIAEPQPLSSWLSTLQADWKLLLDPKGEKNLREFNGKPVTVSLLMGPEGGFSDPEIDLALQQGFVNLRLGPRILRTETAAVATIAAIQCYFGDMGK